MKNLTTLSVLIFYIFLLALVIGCSSSKNVKVEVSKIITKFDYAPKEISKVGASNITIALVSPNYSNNNFRGELFDNFRQSMANDFEELLTSKGYNIRGPFNSKDDMLFNDKENSDFILIPEIDLNFTGINRTYERKVKAASFGQLLVNSNTPSTVSYMYKGEGTLISSLKLVFQSTRYNEKLWAPAPTIDPTAFKYVGAARWADSNVSLFDEVNQDNVVYNEFANALMIQYQAIFSKIEKHFELDQITSVKNEADKVNKKK